MFSSLARSWSSLRLLVSSSAIATPATSPPAPVLTGSRTIRFSRPPASPPSGRRTSARLRTGGFDVPGAPPRARQKQQDLVVRLEIAGRHRLVVAVDGDLGRQRVTGHGLLGVRDRNVAFADGRERPLDVIEPFLRLHHRRERARRLRAG